MDSFAFLRPLLFRLEAERAHQLTIRALKRLPHGVPPASHACLAQRVAGLDFANPVGLAAGFDKNAEVPDAMLARGFGFVEVGTLTPRPQAGNPRPRLFRLLEDEAVINRMGFNNHGQPSAHARLSKRARCGIVGVNVGANKDSADRIADYVQGVTAMQDVADYLTINISSPNTPGLRALQDAAALETLLDAINAVRSANTPPIFLKVAPDLQPEDVAAIAALAVTKRIDALIVANTTISRPPLTSRHRGEAGGLSGAPLADLSLRQLCAFAQALAGAVPLIAVGGIDSADAAYARVRAGASLVQIYSALVFHGPALVQQINTGLAARLRADGFQHITQAVGIDWKGR